MQIERREERSNHTGGVMLTSEKAIGKLNVSPEKVVSELRKRNFGIIGTISKDGRPHATGVSYNTSVSGKPLAFYIMTDTGTKKVRNIFRNPNVSFVVPIPRMLRTSAPMSYIQFQGKALVLKVDDAGAVESLKSTRTGRMRLDMARKMTSGTTREPCFIMIKPDSVIHTFGVGLSLMQTRGSTGQAQGKIELPVKLRTP